MSVDSHVLAMRTCSTPRRPRASRRASSSAWARIASGQSSRAGASRSIAAAPDRPDATIGTDPGTLAGLLWEGRNLREAQQAGEVTISGDEQAMAHLRLFPLPGQAASSSTSSETPIPRVALVDRLVSFSIRR